MTIRVAVGTIEMMYEHQVTEVMMLAQLMLNADADSAPRTVMTLKDALEVIVIGALTGDKAFTEYVAMNAALGGGWGLPYDVHFEVSAEDYIELVDD